MHLTPKDDELIDILRNNARMSVTDIAGLLGVSRSTAQKRLEKIEASGAIASYTVVLSDEYQKGQVRAHVSVSLTLKQTNIIVAKLRKMRPVKEIHSVSGPFDLVVVVSANSVSALDLAIDDIISVDGVDRTSTAVILSTKLKR